MATIKYVARIDGQIVGNRTSAAGRVYTHAIVINGHDKTNYVAAWCGRPDLARYEQAKWARNFRADMVPAEVVAKKSA